MVRTFQISRYLSQGKYPVRQWKVLKISKGSKGGHFDF
jgi:hypothetical protein